MLAKSIPVFGRSENANCFSFFWSWFQRRFFFEEKWEENCRGNDKRLPNSAWHHSWVLEFLFLLRLHKIAIYFAPEQDKNFMLSKRDKMCLCVCVCVCVCVRVCVCVNFLTFKRLNFVKNQWTKIEQYLKICLLPILSVVNPTNSQNSKYCRFTEISFRHFGNNQDFWMCDKCVSIAM